MVIAKFNELKVLILKKFKIKNIDNVKMQYKIKILYDCFKVSDLLKDIKYNTSVNKTQLDILIMLNFLLGMILVRHTLHI